MNQSLKDIDQFFATFNAYPEKLNIDIGIAPQALHLYKVQSLCFDQASNVMVGSQNSHQEISGAYTGEISTSALTELGINFSIIGHSERRAIYGENDQLLNAKTKTALEAGLKVIFCIGENQAERESGKTETILKQQLLNGLNNCDSALKKNIIIAYEPVWAIGTGVTATPELAQASHQFIRKVMGEELAFDSESLQIQYGGSVKPTNAQELLSCPDIDGALIGGASLKGNDFLEICKIAHGLS